MAQKYLEALAESGRGSYIIDTGTILANVLLSVLDDIP